MPVEDPGQLTVRCDGCDETTDMDTTEYAGDPPSWGVDDSTIEQNGWILRGSETYCPDCKEDHEDDVDGAT